MSSKYRSDGRFNAWPPEAARLAARIEGLERAAEASLCDIGRRERLILAARAATSALETLKSAVCAAEGLAAPTTGRNGARRIPRAATGTPRRSPTTSCAYRRSSARSRASSERVLLPDLLPNSVARGGTGRDTAAGARAENAPNQ